jgi:hypothetical protein
MKNPFLFAAGVDEGTMNKCSSAEKNKYATLGSLVYVPLVTGTIAIIFACRYFTKSPLVILFACALWGGVVFGIERALISSLRPRTFNLAVAFRVVTALAMSAIISELLIMYLFSDHIENHINIENDSEVASIHETYGNRVQQLQDELKTYKLEIDAQESSLIGEIEGISGSMRKGDGKVAAEKRKALDRKKEFYQAEKERVESEVMMLRAQENEAIASVDQRRIPGLLSTIVGLHELAHENTTVMYVLLIAHLFFLTIELMPLVIKLSYKGTQYYDVLDLMDSRNLAVIRQVNSLQTDMETNYSQYCMLADYALKTSQKATDLEKEAAESVADDKLNALKEQLNKLYHGMVDSAEVNVAT